MCLVAVCNGTQWRADPLAYYRGGAVTPPAWHGGSLGAAHHRKGQGPLSPAGDGGLSAPGWRGVPSASTRVPVLDLGALGSSDLPAPVCSATERATGLGVGLRPRGRLAWGGGNRLGGCQGAVARATPPLFRGAALGQLSSRAGSVGPGWSEA